MRAILFSALWAVLAASLQAQPGGPMVTVYPRTVERGHPVTISVPGAPRAPVARIWLGPFRLPEVPAGENGANFIVPETVEEAGSGAAAAPAKKIIPLGKYMVQVEIGGRNFVSTEPLEVVASLSAHLALKDVAPRFSYLQGQTSAFSVHGDGFATRHPEDNKLLLDRAEVPVMWDGCTPARWKEGERQAAVHGAVISPHQIDICNVPVTGTRDITVSIMQGDGEAPAPITIRVSNWSRAWAIGLSLVIVAFAAGLVMFFLSFQQKHQVGTTRYGFFRALFIDLETDTYSLSKYQFYFWTAAAVFGYTYLAISKLFVQRLGVLPEVPDSLPAIVAVGAGTAIGSQFISNVRGPKGAGNEKPSLSDLITTGGVVAADRVQLVVWTTLSALGFCVAAVQNDPSTINTLPAIPNGLMYLMGLSSVGYLGGKLARSAGPIIDEIFITPARAEVQLAAAAGAGGPPSLPAPVGAAVFRRVIEIRGRNLSMGATFRVTVKGVESDLPFRMLRDKDGQKMPEIVQREEDESRRDMARIMRLTIPRDDLDPEDRKRYDAWFGQPHENLLFTIVNPDGQKAGLTLSVPPAEGQEK